MDTQHGNLTRQVKTVCQDVSCHIASPVHSVHTVGHPLRNSLSPARLLKRIKHVKGVSCVDPCLFVPNVLSAPSVLGGRLQEFWQVWQEMGANPGMVSILKEGYILSFKMKSGATVAEW